MRHRFAKPNARIHDNLMSVDAQTDQGFNPFFKEIINIQQHVIILRINLHGRRVALRVHHTNRGLPFRAQWRKIRIPGEPRHIIHQTSPGPQRRIRHRGFARVDRHSNIAGRADGLYHRCCTLNFQFSINDLRTRPGGFPANIQNIGTRCLHEAGGRKRIFEIRMFATIRKTVRCDVDDSHQPRPVKRQSGNVGPGRGQRSAFMIADFRGWHDLWRVPARQNLDMREPAPPPGKLQGLAGALAVCVYNRADVARHEGSDPG